MPSSPSRHCVPRSPSVNPAARSSCIRIAVRSSDPGRSERCSPPRDSEDRWGGSPLRATTRPWSPSTRCCSRTCSTGDAGGPATSCATRSSPGSNTPTTDDAANEPSGSSPPSNTSSPSPHSRHSRQHDQSQPPSTKPAADPRDGCAALFGHDFNDLYNKISTSIGHLSTERLDKPEWDQMILVGGITELLKLWRLNLTPEAIDAARAGDAYEER